MTSQLHRFAATPRGSSIPAIDGRNMVKRLGPPSERPPLEPLIAEPGCDDSAVIAHELSQPLAGILSNSQAALRFLRRDQPELAAAIGALTGVVDEAKRAASMIRSIQALARKEPLETEALCLNQLLVQTLGLLSEEIDQSRTETKMDLDVQLVTVRANRTQIQQVLINLLMNAMQAMVCNDVALRSLCVKTEMGGGEVIATIEDCGSGVDPELRGRLFTPFATTKSEGTGLGLSLSASIIRFHGGRIWSEFHSDRGGVFRFSLPISQRSEAI